MVEHRHSSKPDRDCKSEGDQDNNLECLLQTLQCHESGLIPGACAMRSSCLTHAVGLWLMARSQGLAEELSRDLRARPQYSQAPWLREDTCTGCRTRQLTLFLLLSLPRLLQLDPHLRQVPAQDFWSAMPHLTDACQHACRSTGQVLNLIGKGL